MKTLVDNQTTHDGRTVRGIVGWVLRELGVDKSTLVVRVKSTPHRTHHGRFYPHARSHWARVWKEGSEHIIQPKLPVGYKHLIVARIPRQPWGDHHRAMRGGPPPIRPETWMESLVCIVAHEALHFRQYLGKPTGKSHFRNLKGRIITVGPKRWSEVEAEWAEYRILKRYRERKK